MCHKTWHSHKDDSWHTAGHKRVGLHHIKPPINYWILFLTRRYFEQQDFLLGRLLKMIYLDLRLWALFVSSIAFFFFLSCTFCAVCPYVMSFSNQIKIRQFCVGVVTAFTSFDESIRSIVIKCWNLSHASTFIYLNVCLSCWKVTLAPLQRYRLVGCGPKRRTGVLAHLLRLCCWQGLSEFNFLPTCLFRECV